MDDLISRKAAIDAIQNEVEPFVMIEPGTTCVIGAGVHNEDVIKVLSALPSAQPERKGKWIECDHDKWVMGVHALRCSECNGGYHLNNEMTIYYWNFCPVCGADMRGEEK